jgi:hypothetical protein
VTSYTAGYRRSAFVVPATLLVVALFFALLAWAITNAVQRDTLLFIVAGGAGGTILFIIMAMLTGLRVHHWVLEDGGLRVEERPKVPLIGFANRAFAPWREMVALRRIESGFERQIEIEMRNGATYRMAPALVSGPDARGYATDHAGLDALAAAISTRLAAAGAATSRVQEGLSFWNRPPGLVILGVAFVASVAISGAAAIAFWSGADLYGAVLRGAALILVLPLGAGYLLFKSVKRRLRVLDRPRV